VRRYHSRVIWSGPWQHCASLRKKSRREALAFRKSFDLHRDRVHGLNERGQTGIERYSIACERLFSRASRCTPSAELCTKPPSNKRDDRGERSGSAEKNDVMLAQSAHENMRKHHQTIPERVAELIDLREQPAGVSATRRPALTPS
jgi:hypothetical protein